MSTAEEIRAQVEVIRATVHEVFDAHDCRDATETKALLFDALHALEEIEALADGCNAERDIEDGARTSCRCRRCKAEMEARSG